MEKWKIGEYGEVTGKEKKRECERGRARKRV